jgi:hypothetical protein
MGVVMAAPVGGRERDCSQTSAFPDRQRAGDDGLYSSDRSTLICTQETAPMTSNPQGQPAKPVPASRVARELAHLSDMRTNGELDRDEYEHRFSRMISELRDRRIEGNRQEIIAAIKPLLDDGRIHAAEYDRFIQQMGLV